jgi:beclin
MLVSGAQTESLSQTLKIRAEMFDTLSSNSDIDHPLCDECTDALLELLEQQLKLAENEWNDYNNYLKKLELTDDVPNIEQLEKELNDLTSEEDRLLNELGALKREEDAVQLAIKLQEEEKQRLENEEEKYWREYTKHRRDLMTTEDEHKGLDSQLTYVQTQLDKLKKTNVFNVTFHIWHSGHFGKYKNKTKTFSQDL